MATFEALSQNEMMNQHGEENQRSNNDFNEDEIGWIGTKPPYYSGGWSVAGSTLNIIGGGVFSASFSFLHDTDVGHWFWILCPSGIISMALAWGFMTIHAKCERKKSRKERRDGTRQSRIDRYCRRYKKAAKRLRVEHQLVNSYQWQALTNARPQFLKSSNEFLDACILLSETRFPPDISHSEIKRGLWEFLVDANFVREDLLGTKGTWKVVMWANGAKYYGELPNGRRCLLDRTEEEIAQWRKSHNITLHVETEGRPPPKKGEIFPGERGL